MRQVHIIGFGSQASAWAPCFKAVGYEPHVYLRTLSGPSFERATSAGFAPLHINDLPKALVTAPQDDSHLVAMLCPDDVIAPLYRDYIASSSQAVTLVLAHGYAVFSGDLKRLAKYHEVALLAPKAIGPKLLAAFRSSRPNPHSLVAAFCAPASREAQVRALGNALGFADENLVQASFTEETVGDLISEQGLLCGGVFSLLEWTMQNMARSGVPDRLIREECLTELELVAGLLRERGPAETFKAISQAAQCGALSMQRRLKALGADQAIAEATNDIISGRFADEMRSGRWKSQAQELASRLGQWQERLSKKQ